MAGRRKTSQDARIIARLDSEERDILRRARAATGKNTSAIVKAALREYEKTLPRQSALKIFERFGVIGAISGPRDVSERYKRLLDFSSKHGKR
jgi:uncharacterized protein (DUF1778 family)